MTLNLAATDFQALLSKLSPQGDLWSDDPDTVRQQALLAFAQTWGRLQQRANYLVTDVFPATTVEMLPEWEASLGLPDPCAGPDQTIAQRQTHVVARLIAQDGPSIPSLTAYAAALGYQITIQEFVPARADITCADDPCYEPEWAFVWQVTASASNVEYAAADVSFADDPLLTFGGAVLECELQRLSPAHTVLQFAYTGDPDPALWGQAVWGRDAWSA